MAKKEELTDKPLSRKEIYQQQQEIEINRRTKQVVAAILGVIGLIVLIALVMEFFVMPGRAVAMVGGRSITLSQWQNQVRFQRGQLILGLEEQVDEFVDDRISQITPAPTIDPAVPTTIPPDLGLPTPYPTPDPVLVEQDVIRLFQQFAGNQINLLAYGQEQLGEAVLTQMVDDLLIRQEAEKRGITVSEAEVDALIGEQFQYYGGGLPTATPTGTATPEPTPSMTPLPTFTPIPLTVTITTTVEAITPTVEPTAFPTTTPFPTNTPEPTATPVSADSFKQQYDEELAGFTNIGANADLYREQFVNQLYREKLGQALFVEQGFTEEVDHVSGFYILTNSREDAEKLLATINASDFETVWNSLRSLPPEQLVVQAQATELLWQNEDNLKSRFTDGVVAEAVMALEVGQTSAVLSDIQGDAPIYVIAQVTGREVRRLADFAIEQKQQELVSKWLEEARKTTEIYTNWRGRVPSRPELDEKFTEIYPTVTPPAPVPNIPDLQLPNQ